MMYKTIISLLVMFASYPLYAKNISLDLVAVAGESDNSLKTLHNEIDEQQNRYTASLAGDWQADWAKASIGYTAYQEDFADDSEEGQNYLQGDAALELGSSKSFWNLDLRHSRRNLLKDPAEKPLLTNQEERDTTSARPSIRINMGPKNELLAFIDLTQTRYEDSRLRNSDRDQYGIDFLRKLSAVDSLHLELNKTESDFLYFQQTDYSMDTANLKYEANLRKISYVFAVGQQKVEPEFAKGFDAEHYEASVTYGMGDKLFRVYSEKSITDSSFGQGLNFELTEIPRVDTSVNQVGLIERRASGVELQSELFSNRANLILSYSEFDDYYVDRDADANLRGVSASLTYRLSSNVDIVFNHMISDQELMAADTQTRNTDSKLSLSRVMLQFRLARGLGWGLMYEREKRDADIIDIVNQNYTDNYTGIYLNFHFE